MVDVVYTWVDTTSIKEMRDAYKPQSYKESPERLTHSNIPWEDLELSIRMVRKNIPWVRNVFVITKRPQKMPDEINKELNVRYIFEDEFIPKRYLPTFSSIVIESFIHKIPGLSERFIYLNDDMYINRPMKISDFFKGKTPIFRPNHNRNNNWKIEKLNDPHILHHSQLRSVLRLEPSFRLYIHQATPFTKQMLGKAEKKHLKEIENTRVHKFRHPTDVNLMYLAYAIPDNNYVTQENWGNSILQLYVGNSVNSQFLKNIENYNFICLNGMNEKINKRIREVMRRSL